MSKGNRVGLLTKTLRIMGIILLAFAVPKFNANAQTETNLHSFVGYPSDGGNPFAGLVQGSDGNFYGTAIVGGTNNLGTILRISPSGSYTNLYSFGSSPTDGYEPNGLVQGSDGNLYGTTSYGGTSTNCNGGCATVFRISPSGSYTNLYSFGNNPDGASPYAGLLQGSDGNFFGTTVYGGAYNNGTIFRISPNGNETNLYSFGSPPNDGVNPYAGLVQGSDGNFYGTTYVGGTYNSGTVFQITATGSETNLYAFGSSPNDGGNPIAGLVQGSDGNFYGTTFYGGTNSCNCGTVFRISSSGAETTLYSFAGSPDGGDPQAGLVQGSDGNLYGTTSYGGTSTNCSYGCGTVFRISPSGSYTNLYSFGSQANDGANPIAVLVQGYDGNFYGTTHGGGTTNDGTVFKLTVPLSPPPNQISAIQKSGTNIILSIPSIAGETYQLQYRNSITSGIWSNVNGVSITNSIGSTLTLTNFAGANQPQGFYRFAITP